MLAITSRKIEMRSDGGASDTKGRERIVPIRPKDANFGLDDGEAFFFGLNANHDMHLPTR